MRETEELRGRRLGGEIPRRRKRQPTPVCLPGEPRGQGSLVGYGPKECDWTELPSARAYKPTRTLTQCRRQGLLVPLSSSQWQLFYLQGVQSAEGAPLPVTPFFSCLGREFFAFCREERGRRGGFSGGAELRVAAPAGRLSF